MITAAQIICVICMLVPAAVFIIGKVRKRLSEIKPFLAGFGVCFGTTLLELVMVIVLQDVLGLDLELGTLILLPLLLLMMICLYAMSREKFCTPIRTVSFYLGTVQFASFICSALSLISLAELSEGHGSHCDCYYERRGEFGSAEQYIIAAIIRAVIICLMAIAIKKISSSEKLSAFKQAAASAVISTVMCVPMEMLIIWT